MSNANQETQTQGTRSTIAAVVRRVIAIKALKELIEKRKQPPVTAVTYAPVFCDDVYVIGSDSITPVNPNYALSVPSATELGGAILADICVEGWLADPCEMATGSPFAYSRKVPWLRFNNGAERNAGQLAQYWRANSGDPGGHTAETWSREDIAWG